MNQKKHTFTCKTRPFTKLNRTLLVWLSALRNKKCDLNIIFFQKIQNTSSTSTPQRDKPSNTHKQESERELHCICMGEANIHQKSRGWLHENVEVSNDFIIF